MFKKEISKLIMILLCVFIATIPLFMPKEKVSADAGNFISRSSSSSSSYSDSNWYTSYSWGDSDYKDGPLAEFFYKLITVCGILYFIGGYIYGKIDKAKKKRLAERLAESSKDYQKNLLKESDPNFNEEEFVNKIKELFVALQDTWYTKEVLTIKPFVTDSFYESHINKLEEYNNAMRTQVVKDIDVYNVEIANYTANNNKETCHLFVYVRYIRYVVSKNAGEIVDGHIERKMSAIYIWKMVRKKGETNWLLSESNLYEEDYDMNIKK